MKKLLFVFIISISLFNGCKEADSVDDSTNMEGVYEGTVVSTIDPSTDLNWQDNSYITKHTWEEAEAFCNDLDLTGQIDWRLPTDIELHNVQDNYNYLFNQFIQGYYWSSTEYAGRNYEHLVVEYWNTIINYRANSDLQYVRCVHD